MNPQFPLTDLERYVALRWPDAGRSTAVFGTDVMPGIGLSELIGMDRQAWERAKRRGWLTTAQADQVGVRVAGHPIDIWGSLWIDSAEDEPLCRWCRQPAPWGAGRRFCERACKLALDRERDRDATVLRRFLADLDATRGRLDAMTEDERERWFEGAPTEQESVAA